MGDDVNPNGPAARYLRARRRRLTRWQAITNYQSGMAPANKQMDIRKTNMGTTMQIADLEEYQQDNPQKVKSLAQVAKRAITARTGKFVHPKELDAETRAIIRCYIQSYRGVPAEKEKWTKDYKNKVEKIRFGEKWLSKHRAQYLVEYGHLL